MDINEINTCSETTLDHIRTLKENKVKCIIQNTQRKEFTIIHIDSCIQSISCNLKCDYGVYDADNFCFIELKGSDIKHGVAQLESSLKLFSSFFKEKSKKCLLCTRTVPSAGPKIEIVKKKFLKRSGIPLYLRESINIE